MRRRRAGSVVVAAIAFAMSCASSTRLQLQVHVAPDVNDDRPIPVDVVFVWDKATAAKLDAPSAKDWFDRKTALRRDDPNKRTFTIRGWEWVPGREVPDIDLSVRATSRSRRMTFESNRWGRRPRAPLSDKEP